MRAIFKVYCSTDILIVFPTWILHELFDPLEKGSVLVPVVKKNVQRSVKFEDENKIFLTLLRLYHT